MDTNRVETGPCTILPFRRAQGLRLGRPAVGLHPGHVVFFTGVRYTRDENDDTSGPGSGPQGAEGDGAHSSGSSRKTRRRA